MDRGATFYVYSVPNERVDKINELRVCPLTVTDIWLNIWSINKLNEQLVWYVLVNRQATQ